ncbi:hypothetical protein ACQR0V_28305 [Bradyrhizobium sp. HKCCYLS2058]|uniref:hypothetical protein n=1 Tax=unclassified Bradyrhizobium TaxID=2631580 RepID=UPI003EB7D90B
MKGTKISARDMKARWTWGELTSPRFGKKIAGHGGEAVRLQKLAEGGARFEELPDADKDILASIAEKRQSGFLQNVTGVNEFVCEEWTREDLLKTDVIPALSPKKDRVIPYSEFITNPSFTVGGKPEWSDPRHSADSWPKDKPFSQDEPALAVTRGGKKILLDGYGRSVIFMRHGKDTDRFLVWVPAP